MKLSRIFIREMTDMQIIELREEDGDRSFPIVIGLPEAFAIERRLKGHPIARPQTHDLLANVIRTLGGRLARIEIHDLNDGTFFARLIIETADGELDVDSRPSDAIAIGIAGDVPILVAESVLDHATSPTDASNPFGLPHDAMDDGPAEDSGDEDDDPPSGFQTDDDDDDPTPSSGTLHWD